LRKNSDFAFVLKGRGFKPGRKFCKMNVGFNRGGWYQPPNACVAVEERPFQSLP
jgi:hypothetical protein